MDRIQCRVRKSGTHKGRCSHARLPCSVAENCRRNDNRLRYQAPFPKPPVHFFAGERTKAGRAAHEQHNDADLHFIVAEIREILLAVEKQQRVRRKNDRIEADDFSDSGILLQDTCTDCKMMLHGLPDRSLCRSSFRRRIFCAPACRISCLAAPPSTVQAAMPAPQSQHMPHSTRSRRILPAHRLRPLQAPAPLRSTH